MNMPVKSRVPGEKPDAQTTTEASNDPQKARAKGFPDLFWIVLAMALNIIYLFWRIRYTLPLDYGFVSIVIGFLLLMVECLGAVESLIHFCNMHRVERHSVPIVPHELFPDVDIFIATYTEPMDLLYKTINGCKYLDYPDQSKVHIHLCDDGKRPEARQLALEMGINYICRKDNKGAKAGNLNNALSVTGAPLILVLDADMIPRHCFLMRCVPFFVEAEMLNATRADNEKVRIGFVQTPQSFYNPDLFQFFLYSERRIPNEQDYFYRDVQLSRNRSNSVIFGGTNTLLSRTAIEDAGNFFEDSITEDFATGILIQKKGYKCLAVNEVLASGLSPTDLPSLIQQRIRWARGCIQTGRRMHVLRSPELSLWQKANCWASVWYWYAPIKQLVYMVAPIAFAVFGFVIIKCTLLEMMIFWLPMYISYTVALSKLSQGIRTTKWTSIYETVLFPFLLFPVIAESIGISLKKFRVTKKGGSQNARAGTLQYAIPFILLISISAIGIIRCIGMVFQSGGMSPIVVLFWLFTNLFHLVMALFFVLGRNYFRESERVRDAIKCRLKTETHGIIDCNTIDFSESGVALLLKNPVDIGENEAVVMELVTERYFAALEGQVLHVNAVQGGWKYVFAITGYGESKSQFFQIVYDRIPTMPTNLTKTNSSFDDININIAKRKDAFWYQNRRYPRIDIDRKVRTNHGLVHLTNFNYKYVLIRTKELPKELYLYPIKGLALFCRYEREVQKGRKLYTVVNYDTIHNNPSASRQLAKWINASLRDTGETKDMAAQNGFLSGLAGSVLGAPEQEEGLQSYEA